VRTSSATTFTPNSRPAVQLQNVKRRGPSWMPIWGPDPTPIDNRRHPARASKGRQKGEKYCHATTAGCGLDEPDLRADFFEKRANFLPISRPRRPLSRGSDPSGYPIKPLAGFRINPTTIRVESSSTDDSCLRGALPKATYAVQQVMVAFGLAIAAPR
jgi:hypothetical protein